MAGFEAQAALSKAREAASLASYDIQKLRLEDSVEKQALHNLLTAVDALITAVDAGSDCRRLAQRTPDWRGPRPRFEVSSPGGRCSTCIARS